MGFGSGGNFNPDGSTLEQTSGGVARVKAGTANQVMATNAGATAALWALLVNANVDSAAALALSKLAAGTNAQSIVCNATGVPTYVTMTGDATISNAGALTIANRAVTPRKSSKADWVEYFNDFLGSNKPDEWETLVVGSGIPAASAAGTSGILRLDTGATNASRSTARLGATAIPFRTSSAVIQIETRFELNSTTDTGASFGLDNGTGAGFSTDSIAYGIMAFGDVNWKIYTSAAGLSGTTTGSATSTGRHTVRFEITGATSVQVFLDGVSEGTRTTNIPANTVNMNYIITIPNNAAASKQVDVDFIHIAASR